MNEEREQRLYDIMANYGVDQDTAELILLDEEEEESERKIKVSYTDDKELSEVLRRLHPVKRVRPQPAKGSFKRAYIDIKQGCLSAELVTENWWQTAENQGK